MKAYIITDKDIQSLHDKLELQKFKSVISKDDEFLINEVYRFFNYHIHDWISEISK